MLVRAVSEKSALAYGWKNVEEVDFPFCYHETVGFLIPSLQIGKFLKCKTDSKLSGSKCKKSV